MNLEAPNLNCSKISHFIIEVQVLSKVHSSSFNLAVPVIVSFIDSADVQCETKNKSDIHTWLCLHKRNHFAALYEQKRSFHEKKNQDW